MAGLHGIVLISTLCLSVTGSPGPGPITCTTSGTVPEGAPAEVTCDFHSDLDTTHQDFYVYRVSSSDPEIVALCKWNDGNPECRFEGGCAFKTASVDGKVTFQIATAQTIHSGDYICKTLPADEADARNCSLAVQKREVIGDSSVACYTSSPVMLGEDASLFCMFPKSIGLSGVTLEKHCPENGSTEDIVRCNREEGCNVLKANYVIDDKAATYLRVSIPQTTPDKAGTYICRSTHITQERGMCAFDVKDTEENRTGSSVLQQLLPPMYAILVCFILLLFVGLVALYKKSQGCSQSLPDKRKDSNDSEKGLLDDNGNLWKPCKSKG